MSIKKKVEGYCMREGITIKRLCEESGMNYHTMMRAMRLNEISLKMQTRLREYTDGQLNFGDQEFGPVTPISNYSLDGLRLCDAYCLGYLEAMKWCVSFVEDEHFQKRAQEIEANSLGMQQMIGDGISATMFAIRNRLITLGFLEKTHAKKRGL